MVVNILHEGDSRDNNNKLSGPLGNPKSGLRIAEGPLYLRFLSAVLCYNYGG